MPEREVQKGGGLNFRSPGVLDRVRVPTVEVAGLIRFRYPRAGYAESFPSYRCSCGHTNLREGVQIHLVDEHGLSENHARLIMRDVTVGEEADEGSHIMRTDWL